MGLLLVPGALLAQDTVDIDKAVEAAGGRWHEDGCPWSCTVPGKVSHRHRLDDLVSVAKAVQDSDGDVRRNRSHKGKSHIAGPEAGVDLCDERRNVERQRIWQLAGIEYLRPVSDRIHTDGDVREIEEGQAGYDAYLKPCISREITDHGDGALSDDGAPRHGIHDRAIGRSIDHSVGDRRVDVVEGLYRVVQVVARDDTVLGAKCPRCGMVQCSQQDRRTLSRQSLLSIPSKMGDAGGAEADDGDSHIREKAVAG